MVVKHCPLLCVCLVVTDLDDVVSFSVEAQEVYPGTGYMVC